MTSSQTKRSQAKKLSIFHLGKAIFLTLLLFAFLFLLFSWVRYTVGSRHFHKTMQGKAASTLTRITWVHPARTVVIEDPDILNSFVNTMQKQYSVKIIPSELKHEVPPVIIESTFSGDLVFEFSDGSYFTVGCQESWLPQQKRLNLGYNPWWVGDAFSWRAPTKLAVFAPYPGKINDIYDFFNASWADESNVCHQIMRIDATGNIEHINTNRVYGASWWDRFTSDRDHWGEYHYVFESWAYLILGTFAILSMIIARYLWHCTKRCPPSVPPLKNTVSAPQTDQK